ncbi:MAG: hypothetical protein ACLUTU_10000 [Blautia faecis]
MNQKKSCRKNSRRICGTAKNEDNLLPFVGQKDVAFFEEHRLECCIPETVQVGLILPAVLYDS